MPSQHTPKIPTLPWGQEIAGSKLTGLTWVVYLLKHKKKASVITPTFIFNIKKTTALTPHHFPIKDG